MALKLSGDFETASLGSLPQMGAHKYARQPSTRILCFAYAIDEDDPYVWFPEHASPPKNLIKAAENPGVEFHAWNAQFEFNIWNQCGRVWGLPPLPIERFHCSMARALYWGVPPKLEQAAVVVGSNLQKDRAGAALMRKMTKPRAHKDGSTSWWDRDEPDLLIGLGEYCMQDVRTERAVARRVKRLPAIERQLWLLDQRMNGRGLKVDISAVKAMQDIVNGEVKRLGLALSRLTDGEIKSPTQTASIVEYLRGQGVSIDSLDKKVLPLVLKEPLIDRHRKILSLYQEGAKTSTAKLRSMINYLDGDSRARNLVQYGGAMRTLRWAGRGPQIQNYPRPTKEIDAKAALADILRGADADTIDFVHGPPMAVVSQCLRGAYVAAPGRLLAVCDYSAIEARVVAWLAGEDETLDVFRRGQDIYVKAARDVGSSDRMLGKVLVLACGFGMGPVRFRVTAATFGVYVTEEEAKIFVYGWRDNNSLTRSLWHNVDNIIRKVINEKVADRWTWTDSKKLAFRMARDDKLAGALLMKMPSGRPIVYRNARIDKIIQDEDGAGNVEEVIRYDGHDYQKKWSRIRTWGGKVVENATQATARDLLADAMLQLDNNEDDLDVTVHDELIAEPLIERADARLQEMMVVMSTAPSWAQGLPLAAAGGVMPRYGKE
jgi:DNA polymerase bacteriophage-type